MRFSQVTMTAAQLGEPGRAGDQAGVDPWFPRLARLATDDTVAWA